MWPNLQRARSGLSLPIEAARTAARAECIITRYLPWPQRTVDSGFNCEFDWFCVTSKQKLVFRHEFIDCTDGRKTDLCNRVQSSCKL